MLTAGPASATSASTSGLDGSRSSVATPPNKNSAIDRVPMPNARATSAWPNSWKTTLAKSASAAIAPTASDVPRPSAAIGASPAIVHAMNA
jgi:hypothetical protein